MEGGIAAIALSFAYSPPPPLLESPAVEAPVPQPAPAAAALGPTDATDKGSVSFEPGTVTYWETVKTRRALQSQSSSDAGAYNQAVIQLQQQIAASNQEASQDALAAANAQEKAANMQIQQRNIEAGVEAKQAALTMQSQMLDALAPVPAPAPAPAPAPDSSSASAALKAKEASASMEGGVASMATRRSLAQAGALNEVMASVSNSNTALVQSLDGWVQSSDYREQNKAAAAQSTEQAQAETNDATDNAQLTKQAAQVANKETEQPKIPALSSFIPSPPPVAHKKLKKAEAKGALSGGITNQATA